MKQNRSLKQLRIQTHRFLQQSTGIKTQLPQSPNLSNLNIESISTALNLLHPEMNKPTLNKHKYVKSQSRLEVPVLRMQAVSPKFVYTDIKTERGMEKDERGQENVEITPFEISRQMKEFTLKILGPTNRNVCEPKRPKILNKQRQLTFFQEFKLGRVLGKGRFGNVYQVQHNSSRFMAAVKQISLEKVTPKLIERLIYEIKIQSFVRHQNCLELYRYYKEGNALYLLIELGTGSLFDRLRKKKFFSECEAAYYIEQTIRALMYLHANGIIHRDLKPQNIVLINNVVKLADFGWSIYLQNSDKRSTFCGTLDYVSPEIVMGSQYDQMVDVWSVGVLCYELCTGNAPFESTKSREETYRKILNVQLKFPKALSEEVKDFIRRLLIKKPEDRMGLEEALMHPWMRRYYGSYGK